MQNASAWDRRKRYETSLSAHSGRHRRLHLKGDCRTLGAHYVSGARSRSRRVVKSGVALIVVTCLAACMVGPDYRKPEVQVPEGFKEGVDWQRAEANPQAAISSTWWRTYGDDKLNGLVEQALQANQSIASAEAAYRVALATVEEDRAGLFPVVKAGLSGSRSGGNIGALAASTGSSSAGAGNSVAATGSVSWELDLWGQIRRQLEQAKASAQSSDAQLAGERISIAASVASDYFQLRQADFDIHALKEQQDIDSRILAMVQTAFREGQASNDDVLNAQENLETIIADLQATETTREQDEHAIAVLTGVPPASFNIAPDPDYPFFTPAVPPPLPSQLLERRYDVVSAERTAAAANAGIGVAEAAFYPSLTLSAQGGFAHNTLAHLFTVPNRFWTLGPELAEYGPDGFPERGGQPLVDESPAGAGERVREGVRQQQPPVRKRTGAVRCRGGQPAEPADATADIDPGGAESARHAGAARREQCAARQEPGWWLAAR